MAIHFRLWYLLLCSWRTPLSSFLLTIEHDRSTDFFDSMNEHTSMIEEFFGFEFLSVVFSGSYSGCKQIIKKKYSVNVVQCKPFIFQIVIYFFFLNDFKIHVTLSKKQISKWKIDLLLVKQRIHKNCINFFIPFTLVTFHLDSKKGIWIFLFF